MIWVAGRGFEEQKLQATHQASFTLHPLHCPYSGVVFGGGFCGLLTGDSRRL